MAFTREMIRRAAKDSGLEIPKEFEDALITEHITARDSYAENQVKTALEKNKPADPADPKDSEEYKTLKSDFDQYKKDVEAEKARKGKTDAAAAYYAEKGMSENAVKLALRGSTAEIDGLTIEDGKIKDTSALDALITGDFASLVGEKTEGGNKTPKPKNDPSSISKEDFAKMSYADRVKLYDEHPDVYKQLTQ